jgi:hypothetical protein
VVIIYLLTRILKLTTLAPEIVEAIINGEEPDGLSLARLNRSFPEEWREQQHLVRIRGNQGMIFHLKMQQSLISIPLKGFRPNHNDYLP